MAGRPSIIRLNNTVQHHNVWDVRKNESGETIGTVALRVKHIQVKKIKRNVYQELEAIKAA